MELGHALRDGAPLGDFDAAPRRRVSVAILGGGPAGLSAAWRLLRRGVRDFVVVDMEPVVGGTSRSGESEVTRYPWGAHYLPVPMAHQTDLIALLTEMGAVSGVDADGAPEGAEHVLVREPDERIFESGFWYRGLFPRAGASPRDHEEHRRWTSLLDGYAGRRDASGRRAFAIPVDASSDAPDLAALDGMSAEALLTRANIESPRVRWWVEYGCRDDYGLSLSSTSAWAAVFYTAARTAALGRETQELLAWPAGNGALVAHLASVVGEQRLKAGRMVVDVEPHETGVTIRTLTEAGQGLEVLEAERAIVAMPRYVARRIVRPLITAGAAADPFTYGAWLVANLHLDDRPYGRGFEACWDNVLYDSPSLGYVSATHQRGRDHGRTVWTYYLPFTDEDAAEGRRRLLQPSWADWKELIVRDLSRAHPDLPRYLRRLDVFRWGHAMVQPRVGTMFDPARTAAQQPRGRIHYAHSELSGIALFEEAFHHGVRAADEVVREAGPNMAAPINTGVTGG
jgi:hypothetical protein